MKNRSLVFLILFVTLCIGGILLFLIKDKPDLLTGISFSRIVFDDKHQMLRITLSEDQKYRLFVPLDKIAPELIEGTLLQEDQYFFNHPGVNPVSIVKAIWQTYVQKTRRMGASTISMQLARMRYDIPSRKLSGKFWQILKAMQLEWHYSKKELLEAYLNLAPYGGNIEGLGAASYIYFDKAPADLSLSQSLALAVIPQNPNKRTPDNQELQTIRNRLFSRWLEIHPEDAPLQSQFNLPLTMRSIRALPFRMPHLIQDVLETTPVQEQQVTTTIDSALQRLVTEKTKRYVIRKKPWGVSNAAVLVVDSRDMKVKALLGSVDFFNPAIGGQINGTAIKRSPGSTLKPFIYALALDQGLIHPGTVLKDVPSSFGGYNPENFDNEFNGPIKARDALVQSRNIPAIYLANQLKNPTLYQLLGHAHVLLPRSEAYYGLSIALGGVEVSMQELVSLYAMLVNDGRGYPLRFTEEAKSLQGEQLLSPEASFLVLDMLQKTPEAEGYSNTRSLPIAWKTGTSSGFRDAWTVGVVGPYVMAVWIGNFNNKPNPAFIGRELAAPLFFEIAVAIQQEQHPLPSVYRDPGHLNLKQIQVCKASGMLPTRYCTDTELSWFIPGKSPIKSDSIFREVAINGQNGQRTCHFDEHTRFEVYEFWPSDLLALFKKAGIQRRTPPAFEDGCKTTSQKGQSPQIISPQTEVRYVVRANTSWSNQIPFTAVTDGGVAHVYWFVNDRFVAKARAGETWLWNAQPGRHVIRVVDERGLADAREINIEGSV